MNKIIKKSIAFLLTFVMVLGLLTGLRPAESRAAAQSYKTLTFSDWGIEDGEHTGAGILLLQETEIASLDGVSVEGIINFKGATTGGACLRIGTRPATGEDASLPFQGVTLWSEGASQLCVHNFVNNNDGTSTYLPAGWSNTENMKIRLSFDETATDTWIVGIWVNDMHVGDKSLTNTKLGTQLTFMTDGVNPLYMASLTKEEEVEETKLLTFSDWGIADGEYSGGGLFQLQNAGITSLNGYVFEGIVNFNGAATGSSNLRIGTRPDDGIDPSLPYQGVAVWAEGNTGLCVHNFVNNNDGTSTFAPDGFSNTTNVKIRLSFDETEKNTWVIGIWVNDVHMEDKALTNTKLGTQLLFMIEGTMYLESVSKDTLKPEGNTVMTFSDWGIRNGDYSGGRVFVLQASRITSLNGYSFEGIVNFNGATDGNTTLRIGTKPATSDDSSLPFKGITLWSEGTNQLCVHNFYNNNDGTSVYAPSEWSNAENMKIRLEFDETSQDAWAVGIWVNDAYVGEKLLTNTPLGTQINYTTATDTSIYCESVGEGVIGTAAEISYDEYLSPIWEGYTVYDEAVMPLTNADGTMAPIQLTYDIDEIVSVKSANLLVTYEAGKDYIVEDGKLVIPAGSSIKVNPYSGYYFSAPNDGNCFGCTNGGYIYFSEGTYFHERQIVVTYKHSDTWKGSVPKKQGASLPNIIPKLNNQEPVNIVFYGDSITVGANASSFTGASPYLETYSELVVKMLKEKYAYDDISYINTALGGQLTEWGLANAQALAADKNPDLLILAFGMNDINTDPATYQAQIEDIIDIVRADNEDCDIVLVGTMLPNPEAAGVYGNQVRFIENLNNIAKAYDNVAVADVTTMHQDLLARKAYRDMTGNNVNHPNDFLGRIYAQVVLETLNEGESKKSLTFSDWGIDMGVLNGNKTYALTDDTCIESLDGVTISGKVNFNGASKYINIGGTASLRHAGFWLLDTADGLRLSPQGIGGPGADIVIVGAEEWKSLSKQEMNLKISFEEKQNGWLVGVSINGELRNETLYEGVEPGLYVGIAPEITVDRTITLPEKENAKYFVDYIDNIKWNGRTSVQDAGVAADATASGFEATVTANGAVVLDAAVSAKTWFAVYIDGVRQGDAVILEPTKRKAQIASFSDGKEHRIRVVKQNEASFSLCTMISLTFDGTFGEKPAEKSKYIEVIGDSITAGLGNLVTSENNGTLEVDHDGTLAFPYLTAEMLDADVSVVSCSGIGASAHPDTHWFIEHDFYQRTSFFRDENVYYEFERKPDVVVINLGTNDVMAYQVDRATFVTEAKRLVELIREKNGADVSIIWTDNMMGYSVEEWVKEVFGELGGNSAGLHFYEFEPNTEGGGNHPTKEAHRNSVAGLVNYIKKIFGEIICYNLDESVYTITDADTVMVNGTSYNKGDVLDKVGVYELVYNKDGRVYEKKVILYYLGDSNVDSNVNLKDLMGIKKYIAKYETPTDAGHMSSDFTEDQRIAEDDIDILREYLLGKSIFIKGK